MTKQELTDNMREMVKYILPDEYRDNNDIVENYTDTMTMIAEEYKTDQLKLYGVSKNVAKQYAEFCVRCDREGLPLLELDGYIKQYCG